MNYLARISLNIVLLCTSIGSAKGAIYLWDANGATSPTGQDGSGNWLGTQTWWNSSSSSNINWDNSGDHIAVLGNGGTLASNNSTVSASSEVRLHGLVFEALHASNVQAYQVIGSGGLNFGESGFIELRDGSSSAGNNHRILISSPIQGNNVTIRTNEAANLALLNLSGNNTWTGKLTVDGSASTGLHGLFLQVNKFGAINTLSAIEVKNKSTLVMTEVGTYTPNWELSGTGAGGRGAIRFDVATNLSGNVLLKDHTTIAFNPNGAATLTGDISESGGSHRLTIGLQSSGVSLNRALTLSGNNTFTGGFVLEGGTVNLNSTGALNSLGTNTLTFQSSTLAPTHPRVVNMGGFDLNLSGLIAASSASNSIVTNNSDQDVVLSITNTVTNAYAGAINDGTGSGKISLTKAGGATLSLSGANTYSGQTSINAGILHISHSQALGTSDGGTLAAINTRLSLSNNITVTGENYQGPYIRNESGNNTWTGQIQTVTLSQLTLESASGHFHATGTIEGKSSAGSNHSLNLSGAGQGEISGVIQNIYQLNKQSSGSWLISGNNTYTSATMIQAGNLQVGKNGVGRTGTGAVSLTASTAILSGTGQVRGATTLENGKILAGDNWGAGIGTLTFNNSLSLAPSTSATVGSFLLGDNDEGDKWIVHGDFSINDNSKLDIALSSDYSLETGDSWTLIDWVGIFTGSSDITSHLNLPDLSVLTGYNQHYWNVSSLADGGALQLSIVAIPEPSIALLSLLGTAGLLCARRRPSLR